MKFFKFTLIATLLSMAPAPVSAMWSNELKLDSLIENDEEKEENCFCMNSLYNGDKTITLPCKELSKHLLKKSQANRNHTYHYECLKKWFQECINEKREITCMICKTKIPKEFCANTLDLNYGILNSIIPNIAVLVGCSMSYLITINILIEAMKALGSTLDSINPTILKCIIAMIPLYLTYKLNNMRLPIINNERATAIIGGIFILLWTLQFYITSSLWPSHA